MPPTGVVYIADQDIEVSQRIQRLLESGHVKAKVFADGKSLMEQVLMTPPSCIVVEALMPDTDGVSLMKNLRQRGLQTPVIILAAGGDVPKAVDAVKAGAWDYLEKPLIQHFLMNSVRRAIRQG